MTSRLLAALSATLIALCLNAGDAAALTAPDPGGDPTAAVSLPPPDGKYMGFNDDSISDLHGLTEVDYAEYSHLAGGNLIRASFDWRSAEPSDDYWRPGAWSAARDLYEAALARGMTPLFTVGFAPTWARDAAGAACGEPCRLPPARAMDGEWAEFVGRVAQEFPEAIVEVWNEPNLSNFWNTGADPNRYAELLTVAYDAVKAVSPSTLVLGGAVSNVQVSAGGHVAIGEFLARAYAASPSIAGHMDAISFHPYPDLPVLGADTLFAKSFDDVRRARSAAGDPTTPLFVSEVGTAVGSSLSESLQADTMAAMYRKVMTMPDVIGIVFHRLIEPADTSANPTELGSGWLRYGASPPAPREVYCRFVAEAGNAYPGCPEPASPPDPPSAPEAPEPAADTAAPSAFRLLKPRPGRIARRRPMISWTASRDEGVGLARYEISIDGKRARAVAPAKTRHRQSRRLAAGRHTVVVTATDAAGNRRSTVKRSFRVRRGERGASGGRRGR